MFEKAQLGDWRLFPGTWCVFAHVAVSNRVLLGAPPAMTSAGMPPSAAPVACGVMRTTYACPSSALDGALTDSGKGGEVV